MKRLSGFTALVASLIILTNGFSQQLLTSSSSPNSFVTGKPLKLKNDAEKALSSFSLGKLNLHKDDDKMITGKSGKTSLTTIQAKYIPETTQVPTQLLLAKVYSVTTTRNSNPAANQNSRKICIKFLKSECSEHQSQVKIDDDSNTLRSSNLVISPKGNHTNEHLTHAKTKFSKVLEPTSQVYNKFDHSTVKVSSLKKKEVLFVIGNGEMYKHTSNYRTSRESSIDRFFTTNHNGDSQKAPFSSKLNLLKTNQSLFTVEKFPQSKFASFVRMNSRVPNNSQITVNTVLNKQIQSGETLPQTVNRNSRIFSTTKDNKDSAAEEVSNLFYERSKFQTGIGIPTHKGNLFEKVKNNLDSEVETKEPFISTSLKSAEKKIEKEGISVAGENVQSNKTGLENEIETEGNSGPGNKLPSSNLDTVTKESDPKFAKNEKADLPRILKVESIRRNLCKSCLPKYKNSESLRKVRITLFKYLAKSNKTLKNSTLTNYQLEKIDETKNIYNKSDTLASESLKEEDSFVKFDSRKIQISGKSRQKASDTQMKDDTLSNVSRIIKRGPSSSISKGKFNYSHGKTKRGQVVKSILTPSDNATQNSLKGHLEYTSAFSDKENTTVESRQNSQKKGETFSRILFSNYSSDLGNKEMGSDRNFIVRQIRNSTLDKEAGNLKDEAIKRDSSVLTDSEPGINDSGYYNFYQKSNLISINNQSLKINETWTNGESVDKIGPFNASLILNINPTMIYFNESLIRDEENFTKVATPVNLWPVKHSAIVEGDLVLGGLMMVHEREDTITCGPVMPQGGVQALEAMLFTLDRLNEQEIIPGVKIGAHILDDCDKDTYGLEMAVDFIKGETLKIYPNIVN